MRLKKAMQEESSVIPNLVMNQKDHKPVDPVTGLPKTCPVCEASTTHNQRPSALLSSIMQATFQSETTCEATSTEDMLSKVQWLNSKI